MMKVGLYSEDRTLHTLLSSALGKEFKLIQGSDLDATRNLLVDPSCEVVVLDHYSTAHRDVDSFVESSRRLMKRITAPAIIMADEASYAKMTEFVHREAFGYCRRPPSIRDLKALLRRACDRSLQNRLFRCVEQDDEEVASCDRLIGSSDLMRGVYRRVRNVANLNAPVLITGESGTGKELIARAIRNTGSRSDQPFVAISCGAIPETLIESELFGHINGAFTGAAGPHEGYLESAGAGTLFFDEIGELSLLTQVKLLRVLQEMEFHRLGSTRVIPLRARLIFATNQDLSKMVAEGRFRHDLYYRINVMRIQAPSLQQRPEDIPLLAKHFLRFHSVRFGKPMDSIDAEAMDVLLGHTWPGNVRELESVIQRAIIDAEGCCVRAQDLTLTCEADTVPESTKVLDIGEYLSSGTFEKQMWDYKVKLAMAAVRENNGNKALAARSLGMSRAYLYRLISLAEAEGLEPVASGCSLKA